MMPKLTICIPSYNRGQAALRQVLHTLPLIEPSWQILVLDNCSSVNLEGYREIESLSKLNQQLRYIRNTENLGFHGNVLASLKLANSEYVQIVSDEDYANSTVVSDAVLTLDEFAHVGLVRGSIGAIEGMIPRNSVAYSDQFLAAGRDALFDFSLTTNYISGIIYNKRLLNSLGLIQKFEIGLTQNPMIAAYAHMYLDILISASCAVITSSEIVCLEGQEYNYTSDTKSTAEAFPYTFAGRLEQVIGFRDAFRMACGPDGLNDLTLLINLYLRLVQKYCSLFRGDSFLYSARDLALPSLQESLKHFLLSAANIDEFASVRNMVLEMVQERIQACLPPRI